MIWVQDSKPLAIKYVSFASNDGSRSLFFHSCESDHSDFALASAAAHPLLALPALSGEEALTAKCHHIHAWENKYVEGIKLTAIKGSQPDGYTFQLAFYVQGIRDAHILLTTNGKLDANDGYEIGMFSSNNNSRRTLTYSRVHFTKFHTSFLCSSDWRMGKYTFFDS